MQLDEMGSTNGKILMLLPGMPCDYQTNFGAVLDRLTRKENGLLVSAKKKEEKEHEAIHA